MFTTLKFLEKKIAGFLCEPELHENFMWQATPQKRLSPCKSSELSEIYRKLKKSLLKDC